MRPVMRIIAGFLALVASCTLTVKAEASAADQSIDQPKPVFGDVVESPYRYDIEKLAALGIIQGYSDDTFKPESGITRAEFAALLVRALGKEAVATATTPRPRFNDISERYRWAYGYISMASDLGIILGYDDGTFRPGDNVSNAEAVTMIVRSLGRQAQVEGRLPACSASNDWRTLGSPGYDWPRDHIVAAQALGTCNIASPSDDATRAAVAAYLSDVIEVPIVATAGSESFLSLQGARTLHGRVEQVTVRDGRVAADVTDNAGDSHLVDILDTTVRCGFGAVSDLVDEKVEVIVRDGAACFVARARSAIATFPPSGGADLILDDGSPLPVHDDSVIDRHLVNGWGSDKGEVEWPWAAMLPDATTGMSLRIVYDPVVANRVARWEMMVPLHGRLQWVDGQYRLIHPVGEHTSAAYPYAYIYLDPLDPTGLIGPETKFRLNGHDVDQATVAAQVSSLGPSWCAMTNISMDPATGKAAVMTVSAFDSADAYLQPLVSVETGSIRVVASGNAWEPPREYALAQDAVICRYGRIIGLSDLEPGDYVSWSTRDGEVVYLDSRPCDPEYIGPFEPFRSAAGGLTYTLDSAVVPADFRLFVDGEEYLPISAPPSGPVTVNSYWLHYHGDIEPDCGLECAQHVTIYPAGGFADGTHQIETTERTYLVDARGLVTVRVLVVDPWQ